MCSMTGIDSGGLELAQARGAARRRSTSSSFWMMSLSSGSDWGI